MNEALVFISAYLPSVSAVLAVVAICLKVYKKIKALFEESGIKSIKEDNKLLYKELQASNEENRKLREEVHDLKLEIKGIKSNEVRKN